MDAARYPWLRDGVRIPRAVLGVLEAEAAAAYGRAEEACGYLTGPRDEPTLASAAHVLPNLADRYHRLDPEAYPRTARTSFLLDARVFARALDAGDEAGQPVKVIWHSHLDVGAYFSETDERGALLGGDTPAYPVAYLVTSVRDGVVDEHRLFAWSPSARRHVEAKLEVGA